MDKLAIGVIVLFVVAVLFFGLQITKTKVKDIWPINKIISNNHDENNLTNSENKKMNNNEISDSSSNSGGSGGSSGGNAATSRLYDVDGDNFLSCDFTSGDNYQITGNHIVISRAGNQFSFDFDKVEVSQATHPDNLLEVNLKYNLFPRNSDNVLYSNIFLADDDKLYICF